MESSQAQNEQTALERGLRQLHLEADTGQIDALLEHVRLIRKWAAGYNLVSRGDLDALVTRHVLDSLAIHPWVRGNCLLDVGSGAGFPGVPLAIMQPDLEVTLLDTSGKRARFLRQVIRSLGLENVQVIHGRVEDYSPGQPFGQIVSRAFSSLAAFARCVRHLADVQTRVMGIKGRYPAEELKELPQWVAVESVEPYRVPDLHAERHVVIMSLSPQTARADDIP